MKKIHPDAMHISGPHNIDGEVKFKVHRVGANFAHGVDVGEHLSDNQLDDLADMGCKIKHIDDVKEGRQLQDILEMAAKRGRPRKNPAPTQTKSSSDDEDDDYGVDTGPEANQNIHMQLKRAIDAHDMKGGADVTFENRKTHFIKSEHASKVLGALESLKPTDRAEAAAHVYKSHENFVAVHNMLK